MKLSGELDYRIRYDVEHDLFHAQNVFNDEYITPTFIEYVQKLEKENAKLKERLAIINLNGNIVLRELTKAKDHIKKLLDCLKQDTNDPQTNYYVCHYMDKAEQFLKDSEGEK